MKSIRYILFSLFLLFLGHGNALRAQVDSVFKSELFGVNDLAPFTGLGKKKVSAANRISANADELPVRTIVITRDEIQRNGYITLVDVLKTLPGFRTSQPGSAMMGETFLMRGLIGNLYTKILINGVPIAPSAARGMPLGANLPIQSAERIEIVLGAASASYGTDAMAGVINIVIGSVERPVEARGGVGLGTRGAELIHLSLGGKIGVDENILNYNFYASSYSVDDLAIRFDGSYPELRLDRLEVLPTGLWVTEEGDSTSPEIQRIPHVSRMIGASADFRGLSYSYHFLSREDHSGLGNHFEEVAFYNPNNYFAENIQSHSLRYQKGWGKWNLNASANALIYRMDPNSSYYGVDHPLSSYNNFMYAESDDLSAEAFLSFDPGERWSLLAGANFTRQTGVPFQGYLKDPWDEERNNLTTPDGIEVVRNASDTISSIDRVSVLHSYDSDNLGVFGQVYYKTDRLKLIGGVRFDRIYTFEPRLSPQVSAFYQVSKRWRVRGMAAQAFRAPNFFYVFNNYEGDNPPGMSDEVVLVRYENTLAPETMQTIEGGFDFQAHPNLSLSGHIFMHARRNSLFPEIDLPTTAGGGGGPGGPGGDFDATLFEVEYFNANSFSQLTGLQGFINYDNHRFLRVEAFASANLGFERIDSVVDLDTTYSNVSRFMTGLNVHLKLPWKFYVSVFGKTFSSYPWAVQTINDEARVRVGDGFYNVDVVVGKTLSDRLQIYARITNATRSTNHGLYTNTISGFRYDYLPQPGRHILGGLSFDLNRRE